MEVLPPFIVYDPSKMSQAERKKVLEDYREYLHGIPKLEPLRF
jgi:putative NADPH-quinone reductase